MEEGLKGVCAALIVLLQGAMAESAPPITPPLTQPLPSSVTPPHAEAGGKCSSRVRGHPKPSELNNTVLSFEIDIDGTVKDVVIEQSSGDDCVDKAAANCAATGWHYKPAMQNGQPVAVMWRVSINWRSGAFR